MRSSPVASMAAGATMILRTLSSTSVSSLWSVAPHDAALPLLGSGPLRPLIPNQSLRSVRPRRLVPRASRSRVRVAGSRFVPTVVLVLLVRVTTGRCQRDVDQGQEGKDERLD